MEELFWLVVVIGVVCAIVKALHDHQLLRENPQAWKAMKEAEEEKKDRKYRRAGSAAVTGFKIARFFLK